MIATSYSNPEVSTTGLRTGLPGKLHGGPLSKDASRRCRAHNNRGEQCRKAAIKGGFVCRKHGGAIGKVRTKARHRLDELILPAIKALNKAIKCDDVNATIRAACAVLDRCGFNPKQEIDFKGSIEVNDNSSPIPIDQLPVWLKMVTVLVLDNKNISKELESRIIDELGVKLLEGEITNSSNNVNTQQDIDLDTTDYKLHDLENTKVGESLNESFDSYVDADGWITTTLTIKRRVIQPEAISVP